MLRYNSLRAALKEQGATINIAGLPNYSLMHAYVLFLPVLCYAAKANQGWKKRFAILGLGVLCFVIYDTFVTTSLILMIAIVLFSIFYTSKNSVLFAIIVMVLALLVYVLYQGGFFITLIDWIMPAFEGTAVEPKLVDMQDSIRQGQLTGGTITGRQNLHDISWNSFFQNPFFGTSVVGGHSSLIDRLGGMGILAGVPFAMIFVTFVKRMVKFYDTKHAKAFFWVGIIVGFLFLYLKGNWGSESWLMYMVLMPMGILVFERNYLNLKGNYNEQ